MVEFSVDFDCSRLDEKSVTRDAMMMMMDVRKRVNAEVTVMRGWEMYGVMMMTKKAFWDRSRTKARYTAQRTTPVSLPQAKIHVGVR